MELKLDLHIHSERSPDGRMTLEEIVERAKAAGLDGAAVCDHDTVWEDLPESPDFLLIPGTEVSTDKGHLLGLFVTKPIQSREFQAAAAEIHTQGGLAVLAHPFERSTDAARLDDTVPLLDGMESWNARADRKIRNANALAEQYISAHNLTPTGGSDAHVPREVGNGVTAVEAESFTLEAVKDALMAGRTKASGRDSPARYAAASQLTRLKKTGAPPRKYGKWALFALKCCARDLILGGR